MQSMNDMVSDFKTSFVFWYFDFYDLGIDPYGLYGEVKVDRIISTHIKLRKTTYEFEFFTYLRDVRKFANDFDCFAHVDKAPEDFTGRWMLKNDFKINEG